MWAWVSAAAAALCLAALFVAVGVDQADKLAGPVSAVVGVIACAAAIMALRGVSAAQDTPPQAGAAGPPAPPTVPVSSGPTFTATTGEGGLINQVNGDQFLGGR
ncbi:hypothetical protein GCM10017600_50380 [Streptosporangium carneum]|uniref:Uncharacterized protein n=1 Tax=Streptosporangium carneum TaxID=47481 RepID=A0A9W6I560_9ACTN|nr:hypothetical protein GCM10017600_50380 [Streptosporangium carneum]